MSSRRLRKRLDALKARHDQLLNELLHTPPMLRGSFNRVSTRCGKPTCWCAEAAQGHGHNRMTWSEQGTMKTRKVPDEQVDRVKALTGTYRRFRKSRRNLVKIYKQIAETLAELESTVNEETRKNLSFLAVGPKTAAKNTITARKTGRKSRAREV